MSINEPVIKLIESAFEISDDRDEFAVHYQIAELEVI
jgi:hypothetical protein